MKGLFALVILVLGAQTAGEDRKSTEEVRARYLAFNDAWEKRDMGFIRDFFSHDDDMLLFFERRQLRGWREVEALYETMFAHARAGSVTSTFSNLKVEALGSMAYVAANFELEATNPEGEIATDAGRVTVVFEKRDGDWRVVHRHTSFQAPAGPQRNVPLVTDPGPLWSPGLEGAWQSEEGGLLAATASFLTSAGVPEIPAAGRYRIGKEGLWVTPQGSGSERLFELSNLTAANLVLRLPSGSVSFRRVE
ncbi:MAG: YybH family protein [Vicinamibacteria bacterium]